MRKKLKKKWLAALRSGEYVQGIRKLCQIGEEYDHFCCLGVLCDILVRDGLIDPPKDGNLLKYDNEYFELSSTIRSLVDMNTETHNILVHMNDDDGCSFSKIADWIEKNL